MENTDITTIINKDIKVKKPASEAQKRASKKFYENNKHKEEYKQMLSKCAKQHYEKTNTTLFSFKYIYSY